MKRFLLAVGFAIAFTLAILVFSSLLGGRWMEYSAPSGTHQGDLAITARHVNLSAQVNGNVAIIALESATLAGTVHGNIAVFAPSGTVTFESGFTAAGDVTICARDVKNMPKSIRTLNTGCEAIPQALQNAGAFPASLSNISRSMTAEGETLPQLLVTSVLMAALAAFTVKLFPTQAYRMTETVMMRPATTIITGFTTMGAAFSVSAIYFILTLLTLGLLCILSPLFGFVWLIIGAALIIGWIVVSTIIGRIIARRFHMKRSPIVTAALGAFLLTLVRGLLIYVPCIGGVAGGLILIVLGSAGLGAVILTRLGSREYPEFIRRELVL
jgi:hypothetical protein